MEVPTEAEMIHILDTIDQALAEDRPVYVYCWGGHGRTGTVVGCYLRRHDLVSARDVLGISATSQQHCQR
jgi:protein-tyrosine phosphatase